MFPGISFSDKIKKHTKRLGFICKIELFFGNVQTDKSINMIEEKVTIEFLKHPPKWERSTPLRIVIVLLSFFYVFYLIHFVEPRIPVLNIDETVLKTLVAEHEFSYIDLDHKEQEESKAVLQIDDINEIHPNCIETLRNNLKLIKPNTYKDIGFDAFNAAISLLMNELHDARFTTNNTWLKLSENGMDTSFVVAQEKHYNDSDTISRSGWNKIKDKAFSKDKDLTLVAKSRAFDWLEKNNFYFEKDYRTIKEIKDRVRSKVKTREIRHLAGSLIVAKNDVVDPIIKEKVDAYRKSITHAGQFDRFAILSSILKSIVILFLTGTLLHRESNGKTTNRELILYSSVLFCSYLVVLLNTYATKFMFSFVVEYMNTPMFSVFPVVVLMSLVSGARGISVGLSTLQSILLATHFYIPDRLTAISLNVMTVIYVMTYRDDLYKRNRFFQMSLKIGLVSFLFVASLTSHNENTDILHLGGSILAYLTITYVSILLYITVIEHTFGVMSDAKLIEYLDPNNPLLKKLALEAPGTYQHSSMVANLSERAALDIGANSLFCRVSAFYHDVGKLLFPHYFEENQEGVNVHQLLSAEESLQVVKAHIVEGVRIARMHDIPEPIIDVIKEHHGTNLIYHFYDKYLKKCEKKGTTPVLKQSDFRHNGPKPYRKESLIIMISDMLEAASRSLKVVNEETVSELYDQIIQNAFKDGQFDRSILTFKELSIVRNSVIATLVGSNHTRGKYPKRKR